MTSKLKMLSLLAGNGKALNEILAESGVVITYPSLSGRIRKGTELKDAHMSSLCKAIKEAGEPGAMDTTIKEFRDVLQDTLRILTELSAVGILDKETTDDVLKPHSGMDIVPVIEDEISPEALDFALGTLEEKEEPDETIKQEESQETDVPDLSLESTEETESNVSGDEPGQELTLDIFGKIDPPGSEPEEDDLLSLLDGDSNDGGDADTVAEEAGGTSFLDQVLGKAKAKNQERSVSSDDFDGKYRDFEETYDKSNIKV